MRPGPLNTAAGAVRLDGEALTGKKEEPDTTGSFLHDTTPWDPR